MKLLIANRGEIAIRIADAAQDLDIPTVSIYSRDDEYSRHVSVTDESALLRGVEVKAYLDIENIVDIAKQHHCDTVHPGYGFLSENATFAKACEEAGVTYIGPTPETLRLFGDKSSARNFAVAQKVPVVKGLDGPITVDDASSLLASLPQGQGILLKAINGGGGRGMRQVNEPSLLVDAYARATSEAKAAFGDDALYAEQLLNDARHIELQVIGDGTGNVKVIGDRDCSLQRRHQKILEIAPAPKLTDSLRHEL